MKIFSAPLLQWFDVHGRKNLPWQIERTAYRVWISEIMLQQTQVQTVIPYYERFLENFPDVKSLSIATEDKVLSLWSGLGYYSRARNLHRTAQIIDKDYEGYFPDDVLELQKLPGIGPSTAAAIASLAFHKPAAILDGNAARVLSRYFMVEGWSGETAVKKNLWRLANECMPHQRCADYTQAMMDLGALCCTKANPNCKKCPLKSTCKSFLQDQVDLYPAGRPKKIRPEKQVQLLLIHNDSGQIYLEKRPSNGIWGGLWCLPETTWETCSLQFVVCKFNVEGKKSGFYHEIQHVFTHVLWQIKINSILISHPFKETEGRWFSFEEFDNIGLSGPVSRILSDWILRGSVEAITSISG